MCIMLLLLDKKKQNNEENDADKKKIIDKAKWVNKIALLIALDVEDVELNPLLLKIKKMKRKIIWRRKQSK